jgi:hypothetical protein
MIVAVVDRQIRNRAVGCEIVAAADMPVPVGVGEARSGDLDPDLMASREVVRRGDPPQLNPVDLPWEQACWGRDAVAVAKPQRGLREVVGGAVRVHVDELDEDIGVWHVSRYVQLGTNVADDGDSLIQHGRGVNEHVGPALDRPLIGAHRGAAA